MRNGICTSLEQSEKLIELGIDINTADMYYPNRVGIENYGYALPIEWKLGLPLLSQETPTWSLSALLKLIPNYQMQTQDNGVGILYGCKEEIKIVEGETPIDAAFEMVCWLLKNKKL